MSAAAAAASCPSRTPLADARGARTPHTRAHATPSTERTSSKRRHKATGVRYEPVFGAVFAPPRAAELAVALRQLAEDADRNSSADRVQYIRRVQVRKVGLYRGVGAGLCAGACAPRWMWLAVNNAGAVPVSPLPLTVPCACHRGHLCVASRCFARVCVPDCVCVCAAGDWSVVRQRHGRQHHDHLWSRPGALADTVHGPCYLARGRT